MTATPSTDGRRARGDLTRRKAARKAAEVATTHGLDSITVGSLAEATGLSKSGLLTVFGTREAIQVAAVAEARRIYRATVIAPAWGHAPGMPRLRALLDSWLAYLRAGVFPGGCFIAATTVEYGHRDGPVADAVRRLKREWLDLLESELTSAGSPHPQDDAFRIDAFLTAGNTRRELFTDDAELVRAHDLASAVLDRCERRRIDLLVTVRDLVADDLPACTWSGSPTHLRYVAAELERVGRGEADYLALCPPSGLPVGMALLDWTAVPGAGLIGQLAVHPALRSGGLGTLLVRAAEDRIAAHGLVRAELRVETDNVRARTLYERLGYAAYGEAPDGWDAEQPDGTVTRHETTCTLMRRTLR